MPKDTFYFSHDYNARNDEKIKMLIRKHGMIGYGVFWAIVEDLYNNANALRTDYDGIAYDLRLHSDIIKSVVNDFDLFEINGDYFGSSSVQARLDQRNEKSLSARKSASYRWNKKEEDANALRTLSEGNAIKERKGKEIKGKEIKNTLPPLQEFLEYCKKNLEQNKFIYTEYEYSLKSKYDTWVANGWKDGHNKQIKDWKGKIRNTIPFLRPIQTLSNKNGGKYQNELETARNAFKPISE
jgi:hypothetical protein